MTNDLNPTSHREPTRIPVKLFTLAFQPVLERQFRKYNAGRNLFYVRIAVLLALAVLSSFGILDRVLVPHGYLEFWRIRYFFTAPFLVAAFLFTFTPWFARVMQLVTFITVLGAGAGTMMLIAVADDPVNYLYYTNLIIVFMFTFGFSRLRFPLAVLSALVLVALYEFSATILAPVSNEILVNNNFFLAATIAVGMTSCYLYEYSIRRTFFLDQLLESERTKLAEMYDRLEENVEERTAQLKEANEELSRLALYDPLTGLYNRRSMNIHLQEILLGARNSRNEESMALLYIDLDFFKDANDTYGHDVGDEILRQMADRIRTTIRKSDYPCRLGGDEMIVFLPSVSGDADATVVAEKLLQALSRPYQVRDYVISLSASIGISLFPRDGESSPELLRAADSALRAAKKQRSTYVFYTDSLHKSASERMRMIGQLRNAVANNEFRLLYQPIVDASGSTVVMEALLRWESPEFGTVAPLEFIPVLEDVGLISPVGKWIIETACTDAKKWCDSGMEVKVAVNVSAQQFRDPGFEAIVEKSLEKSGLRGELLEIEITESLLVEDVEDTVRKLRVIERLGISFSVDDFGTGYSSLSYLKQLPVSSLKIDASFVRGLPSSSADAAIVGAVTSMAGGLGLTIVAEGVETEKQFEFLLIAGCDRFQGYRYCKPMDRESAVEYARLHAAELAPM